MLATSSSSLADLTSMSSSPTSKKSFEWKEDQAIFKFHSEENGFEQVYCQVAAYEGQYFPMPKGENAILEDNNFIIEIEGDKLRISLQWLGLGSRRELDFYEC